jgi:ABC-type multidrug transport system ATPase subunit/pSer/pThr/pTyr-binding forkhead associated (FHA) protein
MVSNSNIKFGFVHNNALLSKFAFTQGQLSEIVVGRDLKAQIRIEKSEISGLHLQIIFDGTGQLFVVDLGSTNGTFVNGTRIAAGVQTPLSSKDILTIAHPNGVKLVFNPDDYQSNSNPPPIQTQEKVVSTVTLDELFKSKSTVTIGRSAENDLVLSHPSISRSHAKIERKGENKFLITDLESMNGTFVNGHQISGSSTIGSNDTIFIGRFQISLSGAVRDLSNEISIKAEKIQKRFSNGKIGLHSCSFEMPSQSLIAVMGPSGCGKSTLLKALNGDSPPSSGKVFIGGLDLEKNYDYLKTQIGYVPQDDIVHAELTVEQSLFYAAKLRLAHSDDKMVKEKIEQVLSDLNIASIRSNLVGKISGGQRKRVAIAVEILSNPMVLFLDEPTSPLDPQTIEEFLGILRNLAQKGTTVVMVTHKPEDLNYMDSVVFLAEGGHFVYQGGVGDYLSFFGVRDTVKVYSQLAMPMAKKWITNQDKSSSNAKNVDASKNKNLHNTSFFSQLFWLCRRYFRIKFNDGLNTAVLIGQAPIIAGLLCLIFDNVNASVLFLMAVCAVWFGANNAAREIVCEQSIYKRERMFNQRIVTYIFSKVIVLGFFASIQSLLFTLIIAIRYSDLDPSWNNIPYTFLWMFALSLSSTMMGLFISSIVSTTEKVMTIVPIILIPQVMLAGAVAKIPNAIVEVLSYLTLSRWGNEGFSFIQGDVKMTAPDMKKAVELANQGKEGIPMHDIKVTAANELQKNFHMDTFESIFGEAANCLKLDAVIVVAMALLFFVGIYISLKTKDSIKIR